MKRLLIAFMFLLPGTFAVADDEAFAGVTSLKVDLDQVVELGTVSPVNGVTSAGQPDEAALQVFADVGYVAVIDIRGADEQGTRPRAY